MWDAKTLKRLQRLWIYHLRLQIPLSTLFAFFAIVNVNHGSVNFLYGPGPKQLGPFPLNRTNRWLSMGRESRFGVSLLSVEVARDTGRFHFRFNLLFRKWIQDRGGIWQCAIEPFQSGNHVIWFIVHMIYCMCLIWYGPYHWLDIFGQRIRSLQHGVLKLLIHCMRQSCLQQGHIMPLFILFFEIFIRSSIWKTESK